MGNMSWSWSAKNMLRDGRKKEKAVVLYIAEWNVRTLMDRTASQCLERQTTLNLMSPEETKEYFCSDQRDTIKRVPVNNILVWIEIEIERSSWLSWSRKVQLKWGASTRSLFEECLCGYKYHLQAQRCTQEYLDVPKVQTLVHTWSHHGQTEGCG